MFQIINVNLNERVVLFRNGLPIGALGPGRHTRWGRKCTVERFDTEGIVFQTSPEVREVLPDDGSPKSRWIDDREL